MTLKFYVATTLIIIAAVLLVLNSASNMVDKNGTPNKLIDDQSTLSGYWFAYYPSSSCSKCNCSVEVSFVLEPYPDEPLAVLYVNKSDCKAKTTTGSECTCYGYPDYFIGTFNHGFMNGSMGDSQCVGAVFGSNHILNCQGRYRSETILFSYP